jgi:hypothetical protein
VLSSLKKYLSGQGYAHILRFAFLHQVESPQADKAGHMTGDGSL